MRGPILKLQDKRAKQGQHAGLLLQRYLCEDVTGENGNPEEKRAILQAAINAAGNTEVHELYKIAYARWTKSLPESTVASDLQTVGRLIVGLGTENVVETGIRLHHTFGMPIIPGSALKGLAAHYCAQIWGPSERKFEKGGPYHHLFFGTTDESGCIIFHDAWFIPGSETSPLKLDVMTPHHPKWLDGSAAPTDFDSPVPVPFLSVAGQFHVAASWCGPASDQSRNWTESALSLVTHALHNWGVGGKTTSGYGRLAVPPHPTPYKGEANKVVNAVLLVGKTKKGGWRAQIDGYSQIGPIQNSDLVPADKKPGDVVRLHLASVNDRDVQFKWPPPVKK